MADAESLKALLSEWGYLVVFFSALVEAMPVVSLFVPGQAIIIVAGALAALGLLDVRLLILVAIPAGILGDWAGFWLGRRYGRALVDENAARLRLRKEHIEATDRLFERYGAFALVLFRFSFITRPVGPIFCGMSSMGWPTFWLWNVVGAVMWAIGYALLGYYVGIGFLELEGVIGGIVAGVVALVVVAIVVFRLWRKRGRPSTA